MSDREDKSTSGHDALLALVGKLITAGGGKVKELAPGIFCHYQEKKSSVEDMHFIVSWDRNRWKLQGGIGDTDVCTLSIDCKYLTNHGTTPRQSNLDLVTFLKAILLPVEADKGGGFHQLEKDVFVSNIDYITS